MALPRACDFLAGDRGRLANDALAGAAHQIDVNVIVVIGIGAGSQHGRKLLAGGGLRTGQVVGASNARAEVPHTRPLRPGDLLATVYHVLGIDPRQTFRDHSGRPQSILDEGQAITEVI